MRFHAAVRRPRETLHEAEVDGHSDAFEILGVPCNQFMQQDPVRLLPFHIFRGRWLDVKKSSETRRRDSDRGLMWCLQGDNDEIQSFCLRSYDVSFPILGKTDVNGDKAEPVYEWMKASIPGLLGMKRIKWNFEKSLIGKDGVCSSETLSTGIIMVWSQLVNNIGMHSRQKSGGRARRSRSRSRNRYWKP